jgi:4'-phosphopantetheinyl transferase
MSQQNPISPAWNLVENLCALGDNELQIWRIDLPVSAEFFETCKCYLSEEEILRADRRKRSEGHQHAVVGRGALRILLGNTANIAPAAVPITTGPNGRPGTTLDNIAFNVTHSGSIILIALTHTGSVGIDVERIDPAMNFMEVATQSFTPAEVQRLTSISDEPQQRRAFYQLWTQKESIVKADGRGLALALNSFELPHKSFHLHTLAINDHFAAAAATDSVITPNLFLFPAR